MQAYLTLSEALAGAGSNERGITFISGAHAEQELSYAELYTRALLRLATLRQHGLRAGDQLILLTNDYPRFITTFWAAVLGGIIPVPVAVGINDQQRGKVFQIFNTLERGYLLTDSDVVTRLQQYAANHDAESLLERMLTKTIVSELVDSDSPGHDQKVPVHSADPDDLAFIQFSSGSTSEPKGVTLTHRNILTNLRAISAGAEYTADDISLSWMPLTHDMGLIGFHLNMLACDMRQCLMTTDLFSRRPLLWLSKGSEHKATILCSPNFGFKHYLRALAGKSLEDVDLATVRLIYNGAEPISVPLCEQFLQTLQPYGLRRNTMFTVYGLAEATLAVAFPPLNQNYRAVHIDRHRIKPGDPVRYVAPDDPDGVGFMIEGAPVQDCEIRITDLSNKVLASDTIGEIQIHGPAVTQGYYQNPVANQIAFTEDGWLNTGDQGFLTSAGELVVTGRSKDIIFANGQNYYPHDIELVAQELPELELGKVVAYGVRQVNADSDELLIFVLFRKSISEFSDTAQRVKRHISEQTGLEVAHVLPVSRIPKTTSGKLQRRSLGDAYLQGEFADVLAKLGPPKTGTSKQLPSHTALEQELLEIFHRVVKDKTVSIHDNLFDIGISSLTLAEIHEHIDQRYPNLIDITDLFEHQTLKELAILIEGKRNA